jgi:hypothetical protein
VLFQERQVPVVDGCGLHDLVQSHPSPKLLPVRPHHRINFVVAGVVALLASVPAASLGRRLGLVSSLIGVVASSLVGVCASALPLASITLVASAASAVASAASTCLVRATPSLGPSWAAKQALIPVELYTPFLWKAPPSPLTAVHEFCSNNDSFV